MLYPHGCFQKQKSKFGRQTVFCKITINLFIFAAFRKPILMLQTGCSECNFVQKYLDEFLFFFLFLQGYCCAVQCWCCRWDALEVYPNPKRGVYYPNLSFANSRNIWLHTTKLILCWYNLCFLKLYITTFSMFWYIILVFLFVKLRVFVDLNIIVFLLYKFNLTWSVIMIVYTITLGEIWWLKYAFYSFIMTILFSI